MTQPKTRTEPIQSSTTLVRPIGNRRSWVSGALAITAVGLLSCSSSTGPATGPAETTTAPAPGAPSEGTTDATAAAPTAGAATTAAGPQQQRCGELDCWLFDRPTAAFAHVLETRPKVLAIGESHAQKGSEGHDSCTKRFTEQLLPILEHKTTDLVIELWVASGACGKVEQKVAGQQKQVTKKQASSNTNEFVTLGHAAKRRGIIPHILRPSCDEYKEVAAAKGGDAVAKMLDMITRLTVRKIEQLLKARADKPVGNPPIEMLVAYGGLMHNDVQPSPERAQWSFASALKQSTAGRYVELDLIVPEFIRNTESWTSLPWYVHFDKNANPDKTTLLKVSPGSYVLVFPRSR